MNAPTPRTCRTCGSWAENDRCVSCLVDAVEGVNPDINPETGYVWGVEADGYATPYAMRGDR